MKRIGLLAVVLGVFMGMGHVQGAATQAAKIATFRAQVASLVENDSMPYAEKQRALDELSSSTMVWSAGAMRYIYPFGEDISPLLRKEVTDAKIAVFRAEVASLVENDSMPYAEKQRALDELSSSTGVWSAAQMRYIYSFGEDISPLLRKEVADAKMLAASSPHRVAPVVPAHVAAAMPAEAELEPVAASARATVDEDDMEAIRAEEERARQAGVAADRARAEAERQAKRAAQHADYDVHKPAVAPQQVPVAPAAPVYDDPVFARVMEFRAARQAADRQYQAAMKQYEARQKQYGFMPMGMFGGFAGRAAPEAPSQEMTEKEACYVLGIGKDASKNDAIKAYRKLAMKYHPDKNSSDEAAQVMTVLNDAKAFFDDAK